MPKTSQSQIKASRKYDLNHYKSFNVRVKLEYIPVLENIVKSHNLSYNKLFLNALYNEVERLTGKSIDENLKTINS